MEKVDGEIDDRNCFLLMSDGHNVDMELVPHPAALEFDDGMVEGASRINSSSVLASYLLRRWGVDVSADHRLDPERFQLWLRDAPTLYGVESAALAPCIKQSRKEHARSGK